jgi:hypothetical protein
VRKCGCWKKNYYAPHKLRQNWCSKEGSECTVRWLDDSPKLQRTELKSGPDMSECRLEKERYRKLKGRSSVLEVLSGLG